MKTKTKRNLILIPIIVILSVAVLIGIGFGFMKGAKSCSTQVYTPKTETLDSLPELFTNMCEDMNLTLPPSCEFVSGTKVSSWRASDYEIHFRVPEGESNQIYGTMAHWSSVTQDAPDAALEGEAYRFARSVSGSRYTGTLYRSETTSDGFMYFCLITGNG